MKVSKYVLVNSYGVTDGTDGTPNHFFIDRDDRNDHFESYPSELIPGVCCAIGADPAVVRDDEEVWELEKYNGANWVLESVDPNYSLVITEEGLKAITRIKEGIYHFEIVAIKIKQNHIIYPPKNLLIWTKQDFEADGDIILDTNTNPNFTLENNLSWRQNMANAGIQFTIKIDVDTYGENNGRRYEEYTVGAVGLYVADPDEPTRQLLFAIGNLNTNVPKYTTTAKRVGNSIKLLLNTVISNLGYISDLTLFQDSVNSIAELQTEVELPEKYTPDPEKWPYNIYLIDNYAGTNIPALAVRKGDPVKRNLTWQFFTPRDDVLEIIPEQIIDPALGNYMIATWHKSTGEGDSSGFVRADSTSRSSITNTLTGIRINDNIIFAGNVACFDSGALFDINIVDGGANYQVGDMLIYTSSAPNPVIEFKIKVTAVDEFGGVAEFKIASITGVGQLSIPDAEFTLDPDMPTPPSEEPHHGPDDPNMIASIISAGASGSTYVWDFPGGPSIGDPVDWYNMPLYADKDWSSASTAEWNAYCDETGIKRTESKDRRGKFTIKENDFFIGWCTGTGSKSSVKLAMDLQNKASTTDYGTTRYATSTEINNPSSNQAVGQVITTNLWSLKNNYLQITKPGTTRTEGNGHEGDAVDNPIQVDSFVKFNETVVGKGVPDMLIGPNTQVDQNVSFFGLAYRARWGDLAEYYRSDHVYPAGTLITMGCGAEEITKAITECNGIISEKPGYELGEKHDEKDLPVALVGKVPVIFDNACNPKFGDRIYLSQVEPGKASNIPYGQCLGKIIDKHKDLALKGTVLCSVRISF